MTVRVLRVRIKDRHARWLGERAREVNTVWNYCNELSRKVWERERRFLSGFDFWPFLKGVTKEGSGQERAGRRLERVADHAADQVRSRRRMVS